MMALEVALVMAIASAVPLTADRCPGLTRRPCEFALMVQRTEEAEGARAFDHLPCKHSLNAAQTVKGLLRELDKKLLQTVGSKQEGRSPKYEQKRWVEHPGELGISRPQMICEIGLNTGHSAAGWLCAHPTAFYHSFDLVRYKATRIAIPFLGEAFPGRFNVTAGNTATTLPAAAKEGLRCDVISIDGDHSFSGALRDLTNMRHLGKAHTGSVVIMDDLQCAAPWCANPTAAWVHAGNKKGLLKQSGCEVLGWGHGWCWGKYNYE